MSRDRPANSDLKMCIIARQDFEIERASKKTQFLCAESSVVALWELGLVGQTLPLHITLVLAEPEGQTWLTHLHHFSVCWFGSTPELAGLSTIHRIRESWNILSWKGPIKDYWVHLLALHRTAHESHHDSSIFPSIFPYSSFCLFLLSLQLSFPNHCPETALEWRKMLLPSDFTMACGLELEGSPPSHSDRFPGEPSLVASTGPQAAMPPPSAVTHSCPRGGHHLEGTQACQQLGGGIW